MCGSQGGSTQNFLHLYQKNVNTYECLAYRYGNITHVTKDCKNLYIFIIFNRYFKLFLENYFF